MHDETQAVEERTEWLSLAPAAKRGGVSRSALDRAAVSGELPFAHVSLGPGRVPYRLFRVEDVDEWAAARRARADA